MKIGLSVRIDVTKIDKLRLYQGEKGKYLDLTTLIDTEQKDKYDNNGFISQSVTRQEREDGVRTPILGNVRVFYAGETWGGKTQETPKQDPQPQSAAEFEDDIPF